MRPAFGTTIAGYISPCSFKYSWLPLEVCAPPAPKLEGPNQLTLGRDFPRLANLFDRSSPEPFFKGSKSAELEELALTESQLLEQTAALLGVSLAGTGAHRRTCLAQSASSITTRNTPLPPRPTLREVVLRDPEAL